MDAMSFTPSGNPFAKFGQAAAVAHDPRAPEPERAQAGVELFQQFRDAVGLFPEYSAMDWQTWNRLQDAERSGNRLLAKALTYAHPESAKARAQTQSMIAVVGGGGMFYQKPGFTFDALRSLRNRVEVAAATHLTIKRKVQAFTSASEKDDKPGFRIKHRDPQHVLSDDDKAYAHWLTRFLVNGGRDFRPWMRQIDGRRTFQEFLPELVDEGLTHDNGAVELVPLLNGVPGLDSIYLRDGGTFFLAAPSQDGKGPYAYQSLVGLPELSFSHDQLALWQRNRSVWTEAKGYGKSELESAVDTLNSFLLAMDYTREGMDQNAIPRGILTIYGQFDRNQQSLFQSAWQAKTRGVKNRFGLPVLFSRNGQAAANFTSTAADFSEMAFAKWISLQMSIWSAIYGIDPKEISIDGFSSGSTSQLSGDDTGERLASAKSKGFDPLMTSLEQFLSDSILARFDPQESRWCLGFTGLNPMEAQAKREREERVSTINELRASLGMERHPLGWFGELPADAGMQSAEFQRLNATLTFNEGRRVWGGLPEFPDEATGAAPLNPALGALYQGAIQPEQPEGMPGMPGGPEDGNPFGGAPEDGEEEAGPGDDQAAEDAEDQAAEEEQASPSRMAGELKGHLASLKGGQE